MDKNKKGFTLVEILGVMVLLGLIALIIIPLVDKHIVEAREKAYQTQINNIILGAKSWAVDNPLSEFLPTDEGDIEEITLGDLMEEGYVEYDIVNPKTKKKFSRESTIEIQKVKNGYQYRFSG